MKKIFLSWTSYPLSSPRSILLSEHLGATYVQISPFSSKRSRIKAAFRYLISFFSTMSVLVSEKPRVIFTINQPLPLVLCAYLFSRLFRCEYILDCHSGPFNNPKLKWFASLYRFFTVHAFFNINTNDYHKSLVEYWGGKSFIIGDIPFDLNKKYAGRSVSENSIAVVASFDFDEPISEVLEAARYLPNVDFHMTGPCQRLPQNIKDKIPANLKLEGFLSREDYLGLLLSVKGVMTLTKRDFTMQRGAYEALSLERPIITSDWPILRHAFGEAAVYVNNTSSAIANGVSELLDNYEKYVKAVGTQRIKRRKHFDIVRNRILLELKKIEKNG